MPTVTEARLLSWGRGEASLLERDKSFPLSLAEPGQKALGSRRLTNMWREATGEKPLTLNLASSKMLLA